MKNSIMYQCSCMGFECKFANEKNKCTLKECANIFNRNENDKRIPTTGVLIPIQEQFEMYTQTNFEDLKDKLKKQNGLK